MRNVVLRCGVLAAWLVAAPAQMVASNGMGQAVNPDWLGLPATAEVVRLDSAGSANRDVQAGLIEIALPEDQPGQVVALKTRLALQGFRLQERTSDLDRFAGMQEVFKAVNVSDGRSVMAVVIQTPAGLVMRLEYRDPVISRGISEI